jgi:hypothetical protein
MGYWGSGIFDNDGALDYAAELCRQLETTIEEILADEQRRLPDEDGDSILMPSVEVIYFLASSRAYRPDASMVKRWKQRYVTLYDWYYEGELDPEYMDERRQVITNTFERLENLARNWPGTTLMDKWDQFLEDQEG